MMTTKQRRGRKANIASRSMMSRVRGWGGLLPLLKQCLDCIHTNAYLTPFSHQQKAISLRSEGTLEEDCQWRFLEAEDGKPPKGRRERAKRREEDLEYMGWKRERTFPPTANRGTARRSKEEGCDTGTGKDVRNRTRKSEVKKTKSPVPGQNSHPSSVFVDISLLNRPTFEREASRTVCTHVLRESITLRSATDTTLMDFFTVCKGENI